jgi:hypothetical protein
MGRTVKITESELHNVVKVCVKEVLKESQEEFKLTGDYTDTEKKEIEKKNKKKESANKYSENNKKAKAKKEKEEEKRLFDKQKTLGYKGLEFKD